jgi:hypothetical protein
VHNSKDGSQTVAWTDNGTSDDPHASHCCPPDLESEETTTHTAPDARSVAPNHIITRYVISHADHVQVEAQDEEPILTGPDRTGPHVRFRSRVRISAGIGRRFRLSDGLSSNASSISGSPSSSISAPLRTHYTGNNGWGPLGSRVKLSASQGEDANGGKGDSSGRGDGNARRRCARSSWMFLDADADEHTHLLTYATGYSYVGNRYAHDCHHDDAERGRWWRERLVDEAFGKWPGRLLNRHVSGPCSRMVGSISWSFCNASGGGGIWNLSYAVSASQTRKDRDSTLY